MGVGQALREVMPKVRLVAVEPTESNALCGGPPGAHGIMGIGDGFVPALVDRRQIDEVMTVTTAQAVASARYLRERHGYCVGVSSGANMLVALRIAARHARVVTIWPDSADRYASMGVAPCSPAETRCALRPFCVQRGHALLEPGDQAET
jgi:cysteine synthase A